MNSRKKAEKFLTKSRTALAPGSLCNAELLALITHLKQNLQENLMTVKERVEIVYLIAGTISAVGTVVAAVFAAFVYQRNSSF